MAMTGMRRITVALGLLERTPPDVVVDASPSVPDERRDLSSELVHWAIGGAAGAAYPLLARRLGHRRWAGPAYGLAIWLGFEMLAAPVLGTPHARHPVGGRLALALDHALYGAIVGSGFRRRAAAA